MDVILSSGAITVLRPDGEQSVINLGESTRLNVIKRPEYKLHDTLPKYVAGDPTYYIMIHLSDQYAERLKVADLRTQIDGGEWETYDNDEDGAGEALDAIKAMIPYYDAIVDTGA